MGQADLFEKSGGREAGGALPGMGAAYAMPGRAANLYHSPFMMQLLGASHPIRGREIHKE